MFEVSQLVVYGGHGVCKIVATEDRVVDRKSVCYFVLEPLSQPRTRFLIPNHNPAALSRLRCPLKKEALISILSDPRKSTQWFPDDNRRKQLYRQILASGDAAALVGMLRLLEEHKQAQAETGRRIHICDENFMRDAYKILGDEVCVVLQIPQPEVMNYLRQYLHG